MKRLLLLALSLSLSLSLSLFAARDFEASSTQYISAASIPGSVGNSARTVAMWVRTEDNTVRQFFYSEGDETGTYTRFAVELNGTPKKFTVNLRSVSYAGTTTPTNDTWYHVAVTWNGVNTAVVYVNGVQEGNGSPGVINTSGSGFNIGRFYGASLYTDGQLAEVAKWNVVLTARDLESLAVGRAPNRVRPQELVFYAPLVRDVVDHAGALALTDNGPTTVVPHPRTYR